MGCGRSRPKREMLRLVRTPDGVVADPEARRPGRGAYLCPDPACTELAVRRNGLARAFRAPATFSDDALDWIHRWQRSESTR